MAVTSRIRLQIAPMTREDIPEVMAIDRDSFPAPWPEAAYVQELANKNARFFVARQEEPSQEGVAPPSGSVSSLLRRLGLGRAARAPVVCYAGLWMFFDEAHIASIATRPDWRGRGAADQMLQHLIETAKSLDAALITLEVRMSNTAAQHLYLKHGFVEVGRRKRYYHDNGEDALIMTRDLAEPVTRPTREGE